MAVIYAGEIVSTEMKPLGWLLAQALRAIGAPLPTCADRGVPAVVAVTEDGVAGGQIWTRIYTRKRGFPQVIHSAKRFQGSTGLEEHVGAGVGMTLGVVTESDAIHFKSARYFVTLGRQRLYLPRALAPGDLTVTHRELGGGRFAFGLRLEHPLFGLLIDQQAVFREVQP